MASTLMTNADVRSLVQSGLSDAAFEYLVDAADADIVRTAGAHSGQLVEYHDAQRIQTLFLRRTPASVASIVATYEDGTTDYTIPATEYRIEGKRVINDYGWDYYGSYRGGRMKVTYTPVTDEPRRRRALIELVRLSVTDSGVAAKSIDGISTTFMNTQKARNAVLRELVDYNSPLVGMA